MNHKPSFLCLHIKNRMWFSMLKTNRKSKMLNSQQTIAIGVRVSGKKNWHARATNIVFYSPFLLRFLLGNKSWWLFEVPFESNKSLLNNSKVNNFYLKMTLWHSLKCAPESDLVHYQNKHKTNFNLTIVTVFWKLSQIILNQRNFQYSPCIFNNEGYLKI